MSKRYVRVTVRVARNKKRTVWAIDKTVTDKYLRRFIVVNIEGDETGELIIADPVDVTERPARMSNLYAELDVVK